MIEVERGGYGQHISLMDPENWISGRVYGHWTPQPKDGEPVLLKMRSGAVHAGTLQITKRCHDPSDMFFGTIRWDSWRLRWELFKLNCFPLWLLRLLS